MSDFNETRFAAGAFLVGLGIVGAVAASMRAPGAIVDEQRMIEHDIMRSHIARARARIARRAAEAALDDLDASAALRRAASAAGVFKH